MSILCNIPSSQCCQVFAEDWASLVPSNNASLIDILACYPDGILTNVLFIQLAGENSSAIEIGRDYFEEAGCSSSLTQKCYPNYGTLQTIDWDIVLNLFLQGGISLNNNNNNNGTTSGGNSNSTSSSSDDDDNWNGNLTSFGMIRLAEDVESNADYLKVFTIIPVLFLTLLIFL